VDFEDVIEEAYCKVVKKYASNSDKAKRVLSTTFAKF
jgi:hypothetical protein